MAENYRPLRDIRIDFAHSYHHIQDETYRTPVEVLEARYAPLVDALESEKKVVLQLKKWRGDKCIVKNIILSGVVRRRLNRSLLKLKKLSQDQDGFLVGDLAKLLGVHRVAAHKYLNILLASGILLSDGKSWAARYRWNNETTKRCL